MVVNLGAYATEIMRAGIEAVPRGQIEAATALGLRRRKIFRRIVLFQAIKTVYPAIVDVGGGHGTLLAAILAPRPHLQGILYDLPKVVAGAAGTLQAAGVLERCRTVARPHNINQMRQILSSIRRPPVSICLTTDRRIRIPDHLPHPEDFCLMVHLAGRYPEGQSVALPAFVEGSHQGRGLL
jgi:hypothetical protein